MLELAQTLTLDSNRDGTPEQYGLGTDEPEHLLYTTGKHFITFMPDGTARNNIQSPEVARAVAYHMELLQSKTMVPSNARQSFGEGSVAMCIGCLLYTSSLLPAFCMCRRGWSAVSYSLLYRLSSRSCTASAKSI